MTTNPNTPEQRTYWIGDRQITMEPLSFWDLLGLPDVFKRLLADIPQGKDVTPETVVDALKGQIRGFVAGQLGLVERDLKMIPAETGMEIIADWLEMNVNENFTRALSRAIPAAKQILSALPRPSAATATAERK